MIQQLPPQRLSDSLQQILVHADGKDVTIRDIVEVLHGRGFNILVILLSLPFCLPVLIPGLSVIFGMVILFMGIRTMRNQALWLPDRLMRQVLPYDLLSKMIKASLPIVYFMEKVFHPRLRFFKNWASFSLINGLMIVSGAFLLMLPLPIPFTNSLPSISIIMVAVGMIEEDGVVIFLGYLMGILSWLYLVALWFLGTAGLKNSLQWLGF